MKDKLEDVNNSVENVNAEEVLENLDVQGYKYCTSHKQKCLNDCWFLHNSVASDVE